MSLATTGAFDVELLLEDDTWLGLMLEKPKGQDGNVLPEEVVHQPKALVAAALDADISKRLVPIIQEDWFPGIGLAYNWAPGVYTRTPGYALPAGAVTAVTLSGSTMLPRTSAFEEFGGDLFIGIGPIVYRLVGGNAPATVSLTVAADRYVRDLLVFDNGSGTRRLYCFASDPSGVNGQMHSWDGATWSAAATFGANGRNRTSTVWWTPANGVGAARLVTNSSDTTISYTLPNTDPMVGASWTEGLKIPTGRRVTEIVGSRRHIYAGAQDGLFDINELGDAVNLTSYTSRHANDIDGRAVEYLDGYVYAAFGLGMDRVRVEAEGVLQENPGQCSPGWGTRAENPVRGEITALCVDQGWLVASTWNVSTGTSYLCWGKDRNTLGIESPNPLIWHGPEAVLSGYVVDRMRTSALGGQMRLWMVCYRYATTTPLLCYQSLPMGGSPIQDLESEGAHRFATGASGTVFQPYCRLYLLPETVGDKGSKKIPHRHTIGSRNLDPATGTKFTVYDRADPEIGDQTWPNPGTDVTDSPSQDIPASAIAMGHKLERRIDFFSPSGGATSPQVAVLDAVRTTVWRVAPSFGVTPFTVEFGSGVWNLENVSDDRDPEWVTEQLIALTEVGPTSMRDRQGQMWTVKLEQVADRVERLHEDGPFNRTVTCRLEVTIVADVEAA